MDNLASPLRLADNGVCGYCQISWAHRKLRPQTRLEAERRLEGWAKLIRGKSRTSAYDCVLGISGGTDSAFALHLAHQMGLRVLVVHFDNGWNTAAAVRNIYRLVKKCRYDLHTYVVDWPEFRDIQRSLFFSGVVDLELVTDHAFFALLHRVALKYRLRFSIVGNNNATESFMPEGWNWNKLDLRNLRSIHERWGTLPITSTPVLGFWSRLLTERFGIFCRPVALLNDWLYRQDEALEVLSQCYGYEYCGGKHYESLFTKFYQAHILPARFGIDKRKVHFSSLICNGELSRDEALDRLARPAYEEFELRADRAFVLRKLGFSSEEFEDYLNRPWVDHSRYGSDRVYYDFLAKLRRFLRRLFW